MIGSRTSQGLIPLRDGLEGAGFTREQVSALQNLFRQIGYESDTVRYRRWIDLPLPASFVMTVGTPYYASVSLQPQFYGGSFVFGYRLVTVTAGSGTVEVETTANVARRNQAWTSTPPFLQTDTWTVGGVDTVVPSVLLAPKFGNMLADDKIVLSIKRTGGTYAGDVALAWWGVYFEHRSEPAIEGNSP